MPYLPILICIAFAVFFYRAAESEDGSILIWCGLSVLISFVTLFWLHWGWPGCVFGQAGLFISITIVRMLRRE